MEGDSVDQPNGRNLKPAVGSAQNENGDGSSAVGRKKDVPKKQTNTTTDSASAKANGKQSPQPDPVAQESEGGLRSFLDKIKGSPGMREAPTAGSKKAKEDQAKKKPSQAVDDKKKGKYSIS